MIVKVPVLDLQPAVAGRGADHRKGTTLALAQGLEISEATGFDRHDVALLRLIAPDLRRRHAGFFRRNIAQTDAPAASGAMHQFRQRVGQPARAHVMDRENRIGFAHGRAAVDDFLRAALDLRVAALHGIEIEISAVGASVQARGRATTHANQHARPADLHQQRALRHGGFQRLRCRDRADPSGQHDRLVIAAHGIADGLLEAAEITAQVRTTEFVVERGRADRPLQHDLQGGSDTLWFTNRVALPGLCETGNAQMGNRISGEPCLRLRPAPGGSFIADLASGTRGRARERRDCRRMIVRFHFHQNMRRFRSVTVDPGRIRSKALDLRTFDD